MAAGGPEAAAPIISHYLYQERDGSRLSAEQKETVTAITGLIGTAAGAALGSTPADVAQGSLNAKNAVENNSQLFDDFGKWTTRKAAEAAQAAREAFPNTPAVSGFFLGLGDVAKGGLELTDASLESLAMAIHCIGGSSYCKTAVANNQQRGRILLDAAKSVTDGRIKNALEHWGHNLMHGTPEQQRQATEQLARVATTLGVGPAVSSPGVNPLYRPWSILQDGRIVTNGRAITGNGSKLLTPPKALPGSTVEHGGGSRPPTGKQGNRHTQETGRGNQAGGNTARQNVQAQRPKHPAHPDNAIGRNNRNYNPELRQKISNNRGADKPSPNVAAQRSGSDIPYNSRTIRAELEAKYGRGNVTSTTVPPANAPNVRYAGRKQPDSDVVFDHKGFPIFDDIAKYDTRLDQKAFYATNRRGQMRMATRDLREQINSGKISRSQFSPEQLKAIQSGRSKIPDHTWHHHQDRGRMQLVREDKHKVGHIGGDAINKGK